MSTVFMPVTLVARCQKSQENQYVRSFWLGQVHCGASTFTRHTAPIPSMCARDVDNLTPAGGASLSVLLKESFI